MSMELRPEVHEMAEAMQWLLDEHQDEKGDAWKRDSPHDLIASVYRGTDRLINTVDLALSSGQLRKSVLRAAASVGLHAMFVADVMGVLPVVIPRPTVVCLCGSTRFWHDFQRASLAEIMEGRVVLSIGAASGTDDEHFGNLPREEYERVKAMLDDLHLRKIDMADEVFILNRDDYVGESTGRELAYAREHGKRVRWLRLPSAHARPGEGL